MFCLIYLYLSHSRIPALAKLQAVIQQYIVTGFFDQRQYESTAIQGWATIYCGPNILYNIFYCTIQ